MECIAQVMVEPLYLSFGLCTVGFAYFQIHPEVLGKVTKLFIELVLVPSVGIAFGDNGFYPKGTSSLRSGRILS